MFLVTNEAWEAESRAQIQMLAFKGVVNLDGDVPCDSPGHSSKYGTYTLMDDDTGNVVTFDVLQVTDASISNALWRRKAFPGTQKCFKVRMLPLARLQETVMWLISSCIANSEDHLHITHQYDV